MSDDIKSQVTTEPRSFVVRGLFHCDTPNINGHVYPKGVVEAAIVAYQEKVESKMALGAFAGDMVANGVLNSALPIACITHRIDKVEMVGDRVDAEITILPTGKGLEVLNAFPAGEAVRLSAVSLGEGNVVTLPDGTKVIGDFTLTGVTLVPFEPDLPHLEEIKRS